MTTLHEALESYLASTGRVTSEQIKQEINGKYPNRWKLSSLQAHLYGCAANNRKAYIHHPSAPKFIFRNADLTYELYSEAKHGPLSQWDPGEVEPDVLEELVETSISLERDIEEHLIRNLDTIENGLKLIDRQARIDVGIVDILAEDLSGGRVVIEVKVGAAKDSAVGQIARYLGWYGRKDGRPPRGILIAAEFPEPVRYAATAINNLSLLAYKVQFSFERSSI